MGLADFRSNPISHIVSFHFISFQVAHYLVRLEPFSSLAIALQGGRFDHPDRLFLDVAATWDGVTSDMADVKELVSGGFTAPLKELISWASEAPLSSLPSPLSPLPSPLSSLLSPLFSLLSPCFSLCHIPSLLIRSEDAGKAGRGKLASTHSLTAV